MYEGTSPRPTICRCLIRGKINILRWLELILCIICFALAVVIFSKHLILATKVLLLTVSTTFLFITFLDVISWCGNQPIRYRTWIMIAVAAFLMFWLCGGFLAFVKGLLAVEIALCVFDFITGLVFLLDCIWILLECCHRPRSKIAPSRSTCLLDRAVSACFLFEVNEYECPALKRKKDRYPTTVKPVKNTVTSYGGTFPVSKEDTPLPSPDNRNKVNASTSFTRRRESPRRSLEERRLYSSRGGDVSKNDDRFIVVKESLSDNLIIDQDNDNALIRDFKSKISEERGAPFFLTPCSTCPREKRNKICRQLDTVPEKDSTSSFEIQHTESYTNNSGISNVHAVTSEISSKNQQEEIHAANKTPSVRSQSTSSARDAVQHQYYQCPCCKCGKLHYQQQTVVSGSFSNTPYICSCDLEIPQKLCNCPWPDNPASIQDKSPKSVDGPPQIPRGISQRSDSVIRRPRTSSSPRYDHKANDSSSQKRNGLNDDRTNKNTIRRELPLPNICAECYAPHLRSGKQHQEMNPVRNSPSPRKLCFGQVDQNQTECPALARVNTVDEEVMVCPLKEDKEVMAMDSDTRMKRTCQPDTCPKKLRDPYYQSDIEDDDFVPVISRSSQVSSSQKK